MASSLDASPGAAAGGPEGASNESSASAACEPAPNSPDWLSKFPLQVVDGKIVDAQGQRFRLLGVNWYGASDVEHTVGGLRRRKLIDIARTVSEMGFNVVRLPFSNEMLRETTVVKEGAIDYDLNPELVGMTPLQVLDAVVDALGSCNIAVVPNNHCCFGAWGGDPDGNGLWWNDQRGYTEGGFVEDWRTIARRYAGKPWVVGYDLRNEVRPVFGRPVRFPVWQVNGNASGVLSMIGTVKYHDWRAAAGKAAQAILEENPDKLIVVERIVFPAQDIKPYVNHPPSEIPRSRYVIGVHCYSWMGPGLYIPKHVSLAGWNRDSVKKSVLDFARTSTLGRSLGGCADSRCHVDMSVPEQLSSYQAKWCFPVEAGTAPVWVSEFGQSWSAHGDSKRWYEALARFMEAWHVDYAYWALNGGPKPNGKDELYGLLDTDWKPYANDWRRQALELPAIEADEPGAQSSSTEKGLVA